jgi:hypothetical protein
MAMESAKSSPVSGLGEFGWLDFGCGARMRDLSIEDFRLPTSLPD